MTALELPAWAKDLSPAERAGRLAVSIPGWRWKPGMLLRQGGWGARVGTGWEWDDSKGEILPDPDDPATAGCLLALLGLSMPDWWVSTTVLEDGTHIVRASQWNATRSRVEGRGRTLGRAAIAAAAANGRWPGGGA